MRTSLMRMSLIRASMIALIATAAALAASPDPADAQNRRFCSQRPMGHWGFPYCAYDTFEQCRASASGTGAYCTSNPWYEGPAKPARRAKKRRVRRG